MIIDNVIPEDTGFWIYIANSVNVRYCWYLSIYKLSHAQIRLMNIKLMYKNCNLWLSPVTL